jgi:hypothetical protein
MLCTGAVDCYCTVFAIQKRAAAYLHCCICHCEIAVALNLSSKLMLHAPLFDYTTILHARPSSLPMSHTSLVLVLPQLEALAHYHSSSPRCAMHLSKTAVSGTATTATTVDTTATAAATTAAAATAAAVAADAQWPDFL